MSSSQHSPPSQSLGQTSDIPHPTDQELISQALNFARNAPPALYSIPRLQNPIAIPQIAKGLGQPFTRAWALELQTRGITCETFLQFIDGLNVVAMVSPPLQVLSLVGSAMGMVPHHWAMLAGTAIEFTAKLGMAAVSNGRTEIYLREANESYFAPRRLKVRITSTDALIRVLGIPETQPMLSPFTRETLGMSVFERNMLVVRLYCSPLDLNVPPPATQTTILAKMSTRQVERQGKRNEAKVLKAREKVLKKADKRLRKDIKRSEKGKEGKEEKKGKKGEQDKEEKNARKILWILIENL